MDFRVAAGWPENVTGCDLNFPRASISIIIGLYTSEYSDQRANILSAQESEVIRWVTPGKMVPEITTILERSPETIKFHVKNAYVKLGAHNCRHTVSQAARLDLL